MLFPGPALASVGTELGGGHPQGDAGLAAIAVRPVGEHAAAAKAIGHQIGIQHGVNQVAGCGDLRPGLARWQIAAFIGRSGIELQGLQRQVFEVGHGWLRWTRGSFGR